VFRIRIQIRKIRMFLGLPEPHPDPLVRGTDPRICIWIRTKMSQITNTDFNVCMKAICIIKYILEYYVGMPLYDVYFTLVTKVKPQCPILKWHLPNCMLLGRVPWQQTEQDSIIPYLRNIFHRFLLQKISLYSHQIQIHITGRRWP
jgi:hypothetical protein